MRRIATALTILLLPVVAAADTPAKNVILIGWDGAQREHLQQCLKRNELPALAALSAEGALVDIDVVSGATDTKAGWTQILTGYDPKITGVHSNGKYRDVPKGYSVFERLKQQFGADTFICAAVIGKSAHCGEIKPPFKKKLEGAAKPAKAAGKKGRKKRLPGKIVTENGVKYRVFGGSPYHTMHKVCDVWEFGLREDKKVGSRALQLLDTYKDRPFFFFVHFAEVDHSGHKHGENSREYNDALISNDVWTGKIVAKLKALGLYDKTLIYVTADHGFNEGAKNHKYAPQVFLGTNDPAVKRAGMRQDVAPTILAQFGLKLGTLDPPLTGEPLTQPPAKPVRRAPATKGKPVRKPAAKKASKEPA